MEKLDSHRNRVPFGLAAIFLILAAGIVLSGYYYYRYQKALIILEKENELKAVAELKVGQITNWREDRLKDMRIISENPSILKNMEGFIKNPKNKALRFEVQNSLVEIADNYNYKSIVLYEMNGTALLWVGNKPRDDEISVRRYILEAIISGTAGFIDLHRHEGGDIEIGLSAPLFSRGKDGIKPFGVLIAQRDPYNFLYPLIHKWPTPSKTAETLLIRREGDEVIFVNELRHIKGTALNLRFPLTQLDLPATLAVLGKVGVIEGVDYRGEPVIAYIGAVPKSPWFIVSKIDKYEIDSYYVRNSQMVMVIVLVLVLSCGLLFIVIWRQQSLVFYRERDKSADKIRALSLRQEAILTAVPDIIMEVDNNKVYTWANNTGYKFFGEDVIGKEAAYYFEGEQDTYETVRPLFDGMENLIYVESWQRRMDGQKRLLAWWCRVLKDEEGNVSGVLSSARDITEQRLAEKKILRYTEELKRSNEELQQFAYVASHDLQEPLRMVSSFVQLIAKRYSGRLDSDADEFIGFASEGAQRMQRMINDLLSYSRVGTKGKPFGPVDCERALDEALLNLKLAVEESKAVITHNPLPVLMADDSQIIQLFQNLIDNAIKFRSDKTPFIHISAQKKESDWEFSIMDNGIGIAPQYHNRIFKIFQRLHSRDKYPGTGLGLAVCNRIVARHGGVMRLESEQGKGAVFYFTIPIRAENNTGNQSTI